MTSRICLNAWCFEPDGSLNLTKARALLAGYASVRRFTAEEIAALPLLARGVGAALPAHPPLRLADRAGGRAGRAEGPGRILPEAPLPSRRRRRQRLRARPVSETSRTSTIWTDGACSGNPGPGGWGAVLIGERPREGPVRRRGADHQQPHGADGGDLGARGAASGRRSSTSTPTRNICAAASPAGSTAGRRTAGGPATASRSRTSTSGSGSTRCARRTRCAGTGSRAMPAPRPTNAPTSSPATAWRRSSRSGSRRPGKPAAEAPPEAWMRVGSDLLRASSRRRSPRCPCRLPARSSASSTTPSLTSAEKRLQRLPRPAGDHVDLEPEGAGEVADAVGDEVDLAVAAERLAPRLHDVMVVGRHHHDAVDALAPSARRHWRRTAGYGRCGRSR